MSETTNQLGFSYHQLLGIGLESHAGKYPLGHFLNQVRLSQHENYDGDIPMGGYNIKQIDGEWTAELNWRCTSGKGRLNQRLPSKAHERGQAKMVMQLSA